MLEPTNPQRRVDDAERQRMIDLLRRHTGDGRLTLDEFSDRAGDVFAATTSAELEKVSVDLPALTAPPVPETRRRKAVRFTISLLGGNVRKGRWRVAERTVAVAVMGGTEIDLRHAEFDGDEIHISAFAVMGGIDIIVPEGVEVELSGLAIMGGKESRVRPGNAVPGAPVVRVFALAVMGGVTVRNKRSREEHLQQRADYKQRREERIDRHRERRDDRLDRLRDRRVERLDRPGPRSLDRGERDRKPNKRDKRSRSELTRAEIAAVPDGTVSILFTDVEASTELFERLGDTRARQILSSHNRIVRDHVARCSGTEIKNQGDGFMIVFRSAADALRCAVAVQAALADPLPGYPDDPIRVRMGIHAGDVETHDGDIVGLAVSTAARITDAAAGGEIMVSSTVRDLVSAGKEFSFDEGREVDLKGVTESPIVYRLAWHP